MASASTKIGVGVLLIVASTIALFAISFRGTAIPTSVAGIAAMAMAAGAYLVGMSEPDASV